MPSARPGSRAPHVWLERDGERVSTIDLFGDGFVLLAGPEGGAWVEAAAPRRRRTGPSWSRIRIGEGEELADPEGRWREVYGVEADGAVLVRPDGYVGWRSRAGADDPARTLETLWTASWGAPETARSSRRNE